jgi:hypothetical protein
VAIRLNFHFPLLQLQYTDDDMGFGCGDLEGHRERPEDLPAVEKVAQVLLLDVRADSDGWA